MSDRPESSKADGPNHHSALFSEFEDFGKGLVYGNVQIGEGAAQMILPLAGITARKPSAFKSLQPHDAAGSAGEAVASALWILGISRGIDTTIQISRAGNLAITGAVFEATSPVGNTVNAPHNFWLTKAARISAGAASGAILGYGIDKLASSSLSTKIALNATGAIARIAPPVALTGISYLSGFVKA